MAWKGVKPIVHLITKIYEKKIKVAPEDLQQYKDFWKPSATMPINDHVQRGQGSLSHRQSVKTIRCKP